MHVAIERGQKPREEEFGGRCHDKFVTFVPPSAPLPLLSGASCRVVSRNHCVVAAVADATGEETAKAKAASERTRTSDGRFGGGKRHHAKTQLDTRDIIRARRLTMTTAEVE